MKRNRVKEAVALAVCACTLAGTAANAQLVIGSTSSVQTSGYSSAPSSAVEYQSGSFVVNRFGVRDGRLVAFGRLVPSEGASGSASLGASSQSGVSGSGSLSLGSSSGVGSSGTILRWGNTYSQPFDASRLGGWTGIGTGYGESGVESRSNMTSDYDGPVSSMNLARSSSELSYSESRSGSGVDLQFGPTSGNDRVGGGVDLQFGPTSGNDRVGTGVDVHMGATSRNDRTLIDAEFGATSGNDRTLLDGNMGATSANDRTLLDGSMGSTSANDRTVLDGNMGATSGNDRTGIDLQFGPTSGNDRVASGLDLHVGPTSGNDRTQIDASFGATSGNDRSSIDASFGATSGNDRVLLDGDMGATSANDRTLLDGNMGATSGNDRTLIDARMGATSANDRTALVDVELNARDSRPLIQLGGSQTLYSSEESMRAQASMSGEDITVPVSLVSASCDAVSLSIGGTEPIVFTSTSTSGNASLCAVSEAAASGDNTMLLKHLNRLVSTQSK